VIGLQSPDAGPIEWREPVRLGVTWTWLDPLLAQAREWQPVLAGLLAVLAAIILATAIVRAARIRAASAGSNKEKPTAQDLRTVAEPAPIEPETLGRASDNLERLRSLLRSALSSLSSVDADVEAARLRCSLVASFPWPQLQLPANADKRVRETYATFLNQFQKLQIVLDGEWSPSEASTILIQLNASARALSAVLKQTGSGEHNTLGAENKN